MVYNKADGSGGGFSWQKQLRFLQAHHGDNLEEIAHTQLRILENSSPENGEYYNYVLDDLTETIKESSVNNPEFGFDDAQEITRSVMKKHRLEHILDPQTPPDPVKLWCYSCEDFTPYLPMENDQHYCTLCHSQRESAYSSYANTALKKFSELLNSLAEN